MMVSIFTNLYEMVIGGNPEYPEYREGIFQSVGILTFLIALIICIIFFIGLGRWKPIFHKIKHWVITLTLITCIGFLLAFMQTKAQLTISDPYMIQFSLFNGIYAGIYFIILSFLLKRFSIFAKKTPF